MLEDKIKEKAEIEANELLYTRDIALRYKIQDAVNALGLFHEYYWKEISNFCEVLKKPLIENLIDKMENDLLNKAK